MSSFKDAKLFSYISAILFLLGFIPTLVRSFHLFWSCFCCKPIKIKLKLLTTIFWFFYQVLYVIVGINIYAQGITLNLIIILASIYIIDVIALWKLEFMTIDDQLEILKLKGKLYILFMKYI